MHREQKAPAERAAHIVVKLLIVLSILLSRTTSAQDTRDTFALKDQDTVVFFGDSNTEWGNYPAEMENYTLLRYPDRRIRFINAGLDGDMASKAFFRLERDVFARGATAVILIFGINDISWGNYAGPEYQKTYLDYTLRIVDECRKKNVRVYIASYPITGAPFGTKAEDRYVKPVYGLTSTDTSSLQRLSDEAMRMAREHGAIPIDVQREMRRIRDSSLAQTRFHQEDGVHLNEMGSQLLAFALLKGLGAAGPVSEVRINATKTPLVAEARGARISDLRGSMNGIEFVRRDAGLPLTFWAPVDSAGTSLEAIFEPINGYYLTVEGLAADKRFDVDVDGVRVSPKCGFSGKQMGSRLNLATLKSDRWYQRGPWAQQANALASITAAKAQLYRGLAYPVTTEVEGGNWATARAPVLSAIERATSAQYALVQPLPYHYVIAPAVADPSVRCDRP